MRIDLPRFTTLMLVLGASFAHAQIALQKQSATAGSLTVPLAVTFPGPVASDSLVVVSLFYFGGDTVNSVTDSAGNVYRRATRQLGAAGSFDGAPSEVYWARNASAGLTPLIITVAGSGSQYVEFGGVEYAGFPGAVFLDAWSDARSSGAPEVSSGPHHAEANDLLFLFVLCEGTVTGVDGGFEQRVLPNGDLVADLYVTTPGDYSALTSGPCVAAVSIIARFGVPTADAGVSDAGAIEAPEPRALLVGCGCDSSSAPVTTLAFMMAAAFRRRRAREVRRVGL